MAELRSTIQSIYNVTDGNSMVAYNLVVDHQVHAGVLMSSDDQIVVKLNKTVGDIVEQLAFNSDTLTAVYATSGSTGLVWDISGTTAMLKCASGTTWKNEDIIISATINNIIVDKERISYSSSTPILELSNDVGSLMYSADGVTKLKNDEVATTSATVYVNGNAVPTAQVQFSWNIIDGIGTSSTNTVTVSAINLNAFKAQAVCTATFNDINYQKVFKVMRNTQGIAGVDGKPGIDGNPGTDANMIEVFDIYFWRSLETAKTTALPSVPSNNNEIDKETGEDKWTTTIPTKVNNRLIYHSVVTWTKKGTTTETLEWAVTNPNLILAYDSINIQSPESYAQYLTLTNFDQNDALGWDNGKLFIKAEYIQSKGILVKNGDVIVFAAGGDGEYQSSAKIGGFTVDTNSLYSGSTDDDLIFLSTGRSTSYTVAGQSVPNLMIKAGNNFGVTKSGKVYVAQGNIGGWDISSDELSKGSVGLYTGISRSKLSLINTSTPTTSFIRIYAGSYISSDAPFIVLADGSLYASAASITGTINATSGFIGESATQGWSIESNALKNGSGDSLIFLSTGTTDAYLVTGESLTNLMIRAGANFGVTKNGIMYCQNAKIKKGCQFGSTMYIGDWLDDTSDPTATKWTALYNKDSVLSLKTLADNPSENTTGTMLTFSELEGSGALTFRNKGTTMLLNGARLMFNWGWDTTSLSNLHKRFEISQNGLEWSYYKDVSTNPTFSHSFTLNASEDFLLIDQSRSGGLSYIRTEGKLQMNFNKIGEKLTLNLSSAYPENVLSTWVSYQYKDEIIATCEYHPQYRKENDIFNSATLFYVNLTSTMLLGSLNTTAYNAFLGKWKFYDTVVSKNGSTIINSSRLAKQNITAFTTSHQIFFDNLQPKLFQYKNGANQRLHYGFILDEVGAALQKAGLTTQECAAYCLDDLSNPNGDGGLRYDEFISLNTWQIQLLRPRVSDLEQRCIILEARVKELEEKYENIQ